jgi:hypothetical protein
MGTIARIWSPEGSKLSGIKFWVKPKDQVVFQAYELSQYASISFDFPQGFSPLRDRYILTTKIFLDESSPGLVRGGADMAVYFFRTKIILRVLATSNGKFLVQCQEITGARAIGVTVQSARLLPSAS